MIKDTVKYIFYIIVTTLLCSLHITSFFHYNVVPVYEESIQNSWNSSISETSDCLQQKAQIALFMTVMNEFGPNSPIQAAELWIKGDKTRNGVYKYVSACSKVKLEFLKQWGNPENNLWVIGTSSPWLQKYEIIKNVQKKNSTYIITANYYWATSSGVDKPQKNILTIVRNGTRWCVQKVEVSY